MSRFTDTMPPEYFEQLYVDAEDPWRFASSDYEAAKYAASLATLPRLHYGDAVEVGCSIGVFTFRLAQRCERLTAVDAAATALQAARRRCAELANVAFVLGAVPQAFPQGRYDLIVLSEVVYYLSRADVTALARLCAQAAAPQGDILLVHWTGETNYPLSGDAAAEAFMEAIQPLARPLRQERQPEYRLDLLRVGAPNTSAG